MSNQNEVDFLQKRMEDAKGKVKTGSICTAAGVGFMGVGVIINRAGDYLPPSINVATVLIIFGGFLFLIGAPLLLTSILRYRDLKKETNPQPADSHDHI